MLPVAAILRPLLFAGLNPPRHPVYNARDTIRRTPLTPTKMASTSRSPCWLGMKFFHIASTDLTKLSQDGPQVFKGSNFAELQGGRQFCQGEMPGIYQTCDANLTRSTPYEQHNAIMMATIAVPEQFRKFVYGMTGLHWYKRPHRTGQFPQSWSPLTNLSPLTNISFQLLTQVNDVALLPIYSRCFGSFHRYLFSDANCTQFLFYFV